MGERTKPAAWWAILLATVSVALPAAGACGGSAVLSSAYGTDPADRSFIWTGTVFQPFYFATYAPLDYRPPFTPLLEASFWLAGSGDPALGAGNDSGSRDLVATSDLSFQSDPFPVYFGAELHADWSSPGVDGCNDGGACTCLLLTDADPAGTRGLFALVAAATDPAAGTFVNLGGADPLGNGSPIVLREIPRPAVVEIVRPSADTVEVTFTVPTRAAGVYEAVSGAGCFCGPTGFRVRHQVHPRDSVPPRGRAPDDWPVAALAAGGVQPVTPTGEAVTVRASCAGGDADAYFVTELYFDSGFSTPLVSANSIPVECGGNLSGEFLEEIRGSARQGRGGKNR